MYQIATRFFSCLYGRPMDSYVSVPLLQLNTMDAVTLSSINSRWIDTKRLIKHCIYHRGQSRGDASTGIVASLPKSDTDSQWKIILKRWSWFVAYLAYRHHFSLHVLCSGFWIYYWKWRRKVNAVKSRLWPEEEVGSVYYNNTSMYIEPEATQQSTSIMISSSRNEMCFVITE